MRIWKTWLRGLLVRRKLKNIVLSLKCSWLLLSRLNNHFLPLVVRDIRVSLLYWGVIAVGSIQAVLSALVLLRLPRISLPGFELFSFRSILLKLSKPSLVSSIIKSLVCICVSKRLSLLLRFLTSLWVEPRYLGSWLWEILGFNSWTELSLLALHSLRIAAYSDYLRTLTHCVLLCAKHCVHPVNFGMKVPNFSFFPLFICLEVDPQMLKVIKLVS